MKRALVALTLLTASAIPVVHAATPTAVKPNAEQVATSYVEMLQQGKTLEAIDSFIDFDAMLARTFSEELKNQSPAQQLYLKQLITVAVKSSMTPDPIVKLMSQASYSNFNAESQPDNTVRVTFNMAMAGEQTLASNAIHLNRDSSGNWRIIDLENNGHKTTESLAFTYNGTKHLGNTPVSFLEVVAHQFITGKLEMDVGQLGGVAGVNTDD